MALCPWAKRETADNTKKYWSCSSLPFPPNIICPLGKDRLSDCKEFHVFIPSPKADGKCNGLEAEIVTFWPMKRSRNMLKHYDQRENKVLKASSQKWRQEELNSRVLRHEQEAALVPRGLVLSSNQEKSPEQQGVMAAAQNHHVPAGSYTMLHSTTDPTQSYRAARRIQAASWDAFLDQCTSRTGTFMSWWETKDQPNILTTGQSNFCASIQVWHGFIN